MDDPEALAVEADRYSRALHQRELARRKRRDRHYGQVEILRSVENVPTAQPQIDLWELPGYEEGCGLPKSISVSVVDKEVETLVRLLGSLDQEWTHRVAGMKRLTTVLTSESGKRAFQVHHAKAIKEGLVLQLTDLRSSLVKEACDSIALALELGTEAFEPFSGFIVSAGLNVIIKTTKVVRDAGDMMIRRIIRAVQPDKSHLDTICRAVSTGAHPVEREFCAKYISKLISRGAPPEPIGSSLLAGITDSAERVRKECRSAFIEYERKWPQAAETIFNRYANLARDERSPFCPEQNLIQVTSSCRMDATSQRKVRGVGKTNVSRVPIAELRRNAALQRKMTAKSNVPMSSNPQTNDENNPAIINSLIIQ